MERTCSAAPLWAFKCWGECFHVKSFLLINKLQNYQIFHSWISFYIYLVEYSSRPKIEGKTKDFKLRLFQSEFLCLGLEAFFRRKQISIHAAFSQCRKEKQTRELCMCKMNSVPEQIFMLLVVAFGK